MVSAGRHLPRVRLRRFARPCRARRCWPPRAAALGAEPPDLGFPQHSAELRERLAARARGARAGLRRRAASTAAPTAARDSPIDCCSRRSPYLRQHAHNPVDWYAWGPEALAAAAREDKPIFLSIGYSTCHWCHVMERESFDDLGIAALLGASFIAIKVDREERPDLDDVYMTAMPAHRSGRWLAAAELPHADRAAVLRHDLSAARSVRRAPGVVATAWRDRPGRARGRRGEPRRRRARGGRGARRGGRDRRRRGCARDARSCSRSTTPSTAASAERPSSRASPSCSSCSTRPRAARRADAARVAERALDGMARGGIFDQVGRRLPSLLDRRRVAGAALREDALQPGAARARLPRRLPTHRTRLVPPRRRADARLRAARDDRRPRAASTRRPTPTATASRAASSSGLRPSSKQALGAADGAWAARVFGDHAPKATSRTGAPCCICRSRSTAWRARPGPARRHARSSRPRARAAARRARASAPPPLRDDKMLTAWNGMMITALAEGYAVARRRRAGATAAERAADLLWTTARRGPGPAAGACGSTATSSVEGLLEDHACVAEGLLALYDATGDPPLPGERATEILDGMIEQFWDGRTAGSSSAAPETATGVRATEVTAGRRDAIGELGRVARAGDGVPAHRRGPLSRARRRAGGRVLGLDPTLAGELSVSAARARRAREWRHRHAALRGARQGRAIAVAVRPPAAGAATAPARRSRSCSTSHPGGTSTRRPRSTRT